MFSKAKVIHIPYSVVELLLFEVELLMQWLFIGKNNNNSTINNNLKKKAINILQVSEL